MGPIDEWDPAFVAALDLLLGSSFPIFITWGADDQIFFNDAYAPIVEMKGECLGLPFREVFREAWPTVSPPFMRALSGEASFSEDFEVPLLRGGGLARSWWSFSYSPARDIGGTVRGVLGIVYETTGRLLAEQALRSSEAALRSVTDTAPGLLWRCGADGALSWMNQRLQTYLGVSLPTDVRLQDRIHPEDIDRAETTRSEAEAGPQAFSGQFRLRDADGRFRWFFIRAQQVCTGDGRLVGWCGSAVDIHDWRLAATVARDGQDLLKAVAEASASLLWTIDLGSGTITGLNPEFRSAWALPPSGETCPLETWLAQLLDEDRTQVTSALDLVARGDTIQGRFRVRTEGGLRTFHATAFPIASCDGVIRRIGGLLVDVTQSVEARAYIVHNDPAAQNRLVHAFTQAGFKARGFDDVRPFARLADDLEPGVVVLASEADFDRVYRAAAMLARTGKRLPWIVTARLGDRLDTVVQLMKLGASDVLPYHAALSTLVSAARAVKVSPARSAEPGSGQPGVTLSDLPRREREVFEGLRAGGTNKSIALAMSLSPRTIETYRAQLMERLGVRSLAELLQWAQKLDR